MVQLIQSTIVNVLIFKYIRKHTSYLFSSVLFYYILSFIGYNMEIMRASISIAICLFANDYVYSKKWVKGYLLYFIALMFHVQTIVMFFFPIFRHLKLNKNSIMLLLFAFFMGIILQKMLGDYIFLLEGNDHLFRKMSTYSEDYGSMTILGMLGVIVNSIILPILSLLYLRKNSTDRIYVYIEPFVLCGVLFALMRMSVPLVSRYQEYFHVHFSILYANVIVLLAQKVGRLNKTLAISRMMIILIPWLMMNVYLYYKTQKYYPYSSIFEKNVYSNKEKIFKERDNYYVYPNHKY